jgi:predicted RNase H-like nuclease
VSYSEACEVRFQAEYKRLSKQAWAIVPKVRDVDKFLRANDDARHHVHEVHPEVCFYYMASERPMRFSKKRPAGRDERVSVLRTSFDHVLDEALRDRSRLECELDDLLDAFAALWTARRIREGTTVRLPAVLPRDPFGLPMEIVA